MVVSALVEKTYINYSFTFGEKFIQGRVSSVDTEKQQVVLENQQQVPYDILVLATGCKARVEVPTKLWSQSKKEAQEIFNALNQKVSVTSACVFTFLFHYLSLGLCKQIWPFVYLATRTDIYI